jgi:hypothetical protein
MLPRLFAAFFAGVVAIPVAVTARAVANYAFNPERFRTVSLNDRIDGIVGWSVGGILVVLPMLALYAIPAFLILRRYGLANLLTCTTVALVPPIAYAIAFRDVRFFWQYGYYAVASAWAFWSVARRIPRLLPPNNRWREP